MKVDSVTNLGNKKGLPEDSPVVNVLGLLGGSSSHF